MVVSVNAAHALVATGVLFAQQPNQALLERLEPPKRAAVVLAIFAIVLTGLTLVIGVMIGAHWVRRMARHRPRGSNPTISANSKSVAPSRLPSSTASATEAKTDATVQIDASTKETKLDR